MSGEGSCRGLQTLLSLIRAPGLRDGFDMVDDRDGNTYLRKARETSQESGLTASDSGGHWRLFRGKATWGSRSRAPDHQAGPRIEYKRRFSTASRCQVQSLAHDKGWHRPQSLSGLDKRVTFKNLSLLPVMRATQLTGLQTVPPLAV
jgi:hypothetical protein